MNESTESGSARAAEVRGKGERHSTRAGRTVRASLGVLEKEQEGGGNQGASPRARAGRASQVGWAICSAKPAERHGDAQSMLKWSLRVPTTSTQAVAARATGKRQTSGNKNLRSVALRCWQSRLAGSCCRLLPFLLLLSYWKREAPRQSCSVGGNTGTGEPSPDETPRASASTLRVRLGALAQSCQAGDSTTAR